MFSCFITLPNTSTILITASDSKFLALILTLSLKGFGATDRPKTLFEESSFIPTVLVMVKLLSLMSKKILVGQTTFILQVLTVAVTLGTVINEDPIFGTPA